MNRMLLAAFVLFATGLPAIGQQIILNLNSLDPPDVGDYFAPTGTQGPFSAGTVQTTPGGATVTLSVDPANFLWFTSDATCDQSSLSKTIDITTNAGAPSNIPFCVIDVPPGGSFFVLITASAANFPTVSGAAPIDCFPGGSVNAKPSATQDITGGPVTVIISNSLPTGLTNYSVEYAPGIPGGWLNESESPACAGLAADPNVGTPVSCNVTLSANANAVGIANSVYTAQVRFTAEDSQDIANVGAISVKYVVPAAVIPPPPVVPVAITSANSFFLLIGQPFSASLAATGGTGVYSWTASALPAGLSLSPSGILSGVISAQVSAQATFTVQDSAGASASQLVTFASNAPPVIPPVVITSANSFLVLPGQPFLARLTAAGGTGVYSWTASALPAGLFLSAGGILSGIISAPVSAQATFMVQDSAGATASQVVTFTSNAPLLFVPLTPCRVADTRSKTSGAFGVPSLVAGQVRSFLIPSGACPNIPATAAAYSMNVTAVPHGVLGYLSIWPSGQSQPLVSTLNSYDGRTKANAVIVPAGFSGGVSVYVTNDADVVLDINGYFALQSAIVLPAQGFEFYPLPPCRVFDSRRATGPLGAPSLGASEQRAIPVIESGCGVPPNASAYSVNMTAIPKEGVLGYLSTWPTGVAQPYVSTLNATTGTITANAALIPAGTDGEISVFVTNPADVVVDIDGYFAPAGSGGLRLYNLSPCRVHDTRQPHGSPPFQGVLNPALDAACGIPGGAQALVLNATVVPPSAFGFLSLWAAGTPQPDVSTLNAFDGSVTSNLAIVPASSGMVSAYASNLTQLILDVSGYFAP